MTAVVFDRVVASLSSRDARAEVCGAAVAAVVTRCADPKVLFIHRVSHDGDPWSGHLAFPGGRIEPDDSSDRHAAERETFEEVGLDLSAADVVGRLDDIAGHTIPLRVSCHVYGIDALPELTPNEEVEDVFALPLSTLADGSRHLEAEFEIRGERRAYPAIETGVVGKPLLWGLTYRFVTQLLHHSGMGHGA